jgi:hypothetical protein
MTDPTSRETGRQIREKTETFRKQPSDRKNIWSKVPQWAGYLDILTD